MNSSHQDHWQPDLYDSKHAYVWQEGVAVLDLLAAKSGERILDIGCGTGQLTNQIASCGAVVTGIDSSPAMIEEASAKYPQVAFRVQDGHEFSTDQPFDAVFSNAAIHWFKEPDKLARCVSLSLREQGRFVVEFGGRGNVQRLTDALEEASETLLGTRIRHPWYFPSIADFSQLLQQNRLEVRQAAIIDRPTRLEGDEGVKNWVRMFGSHWLNHVSKDATEAFLSRVEDSARPYLLDSKGWFADYRRIRIVAERRD